MRGLTSAAAKFMGTLHGLLSAHGDHELDCSGVSAAPPFSKKLSATGNGSVTAGGALVSSRLIVLAVESRLKPALFSEFNHPPWLSDYRRSRKRWQNLRNCCMLG